MRLIHTSDWHLGRHLKGKDRTPEIEFALQQLLRQAKELEVDAVLIAGDIFETSNPPAEAERVAYQFFEGLRTAKIPAIAIAGNHDSASRFDGIANLVSLAGVHILGKPRNVKQGGLISLETPNGRLRVAAMPFASERRLLTVENLWTMNELEQIGNYKERLSKCLNNLAGGFQDDSVNIFMAHLTIDGARLANSEARHHTKETYALAGQSLPAEAQYIALGHIHKPQQIPVAAPTYYSGSLIQVDFGEVGEDKGFYLIDVEPGSPAKPQFISIPCQKPLQIVECELSDYEEKLEPLRDYSGYLKVIIKLQTPQMGLADKIRKICGDKVLQIEPSYPEVKPNQEKSVSREDFDPVEEFKRYFQDVLKTTPNSAVVAKFEQLYKEIKENQDATT
ncbi:exonuclease SbcCD subunit D [Nostoc sp. FACHB-87]|uniref:exonuclease SbcCD subunit D n=1 Tax=Nostocales TaxID=1161 RepID=UPI0016865095|nr:MULTISPECIES: exonuclease SbcCD subunit D [Nostocales]MBD2453401.1 exonuclease SbcCD subunit D [Nostoc sp. FACHB-87]MBD2475526.1 exonuclease SbcCD subunit D [Anabaena sp. FACHB-83]MBD2490296.1 exonuclease SbcCD subunit D [Aulosira sp. FACHB-615]